MLNATFRGTIMRSLASVPIGLTTQVIDVSGEDSVSLRLLGNGAYSRC